MFEQRLAETGKDPVGSLERPGWLAFQQELQRFRQHDVGDRQHAGGCDRGGNEHCPPAVFRYYPGGDESREYRTHCIAGADSRNDEIAVTRRRILSGNRRQRGAGCADTYSC